MSRSLSPSRAAPALPLPQARVQHPPPPAREALTRLVALLPPDAEASLVEYKPVARAQEEARFYREAARHALTAAAAADALCDVAAVRDDDLQCEVLELQGARVRLELPCRVRVPGLVVQLKDLGHFLSFEVHARDAAGAALTMTVSNKCTAIRLLGTTCTLPLETGPGWNLLRLDLPDLVRRAFGREFLYCTGVVLLATMRVARVYFESQPIEDVDLPPFLRTISEEDGGGGAR